MSCQLGEARWAYGAARAGGGGGEALAREVPAGAVVDARAVGGGALVSSTIYLEGGGDARDLQIRCREGYANCWSGAATQVVYRNWWRAAGGVRRSTPSRPPWPAPGKATL